MEKCSNIILNHCHELNDQNITIKNLKSIKEHKERFFQILDIVVESVESGNEIKKNFVQRSKELEAYKQAFNVMSYLNEFLLKLPEQIGKLESDTCPTVKLLFGLENESSSSKVNFKAT